MNKWYKSIWIKGILSLLICLSVITITIGGITIIKGTYNNITWDDITHNKTQDYTKTKAFANTLIDSESYIIEQIRNNFMFETDGKFDENKIVDIKEFTSQDTITGKNVSGFAYTLKDLLSWNDKNPDFGSTSYIVCKKLDGTYFYYNFSEFKKEIVAGNLKFNISDDDSVTSDGILNELNYGTYVSDSTSKIAVFNKENQLLYSDCWTLVSSLNESYPPIGASSILDIVNHKPEWNGKLSDMLQNLDSSISDLQSDYSYYEHPNQDYSEGNSNLAYILLDRTNHKLYTNRSDYNDYDKAVQNIDFMKKMGSYIIITPELKGFETNLDISAANWMQHKLYLGDQKETADYLFAIAIDTGFPIQDTFYADDANYNAFAPHIIPLIALVCISFLFFLIAMVWLTLIAGRSVHNDSITLHAFDKIWTELAAGIVIGIWLLFFCGMINLLDNYYLGSVYVANSTKIGIPATICTIITALVTSIFFLIGWLSLVRRIKAGTLWKNSILRKLVHLVARIIRAIRKFFHDFWDHRNESFKIVLICIVLMILHLFCGIRGFYDVWPVFLMLAVDIAFAIYLIRIAVIHNQIKDGIREISEGNVAHRIDTTHLKGNNLQIATLVNNIGNGLHAALEQSMKDERMKTDLITNVSHDIKTPLTSIINYVDLLKREQFSDPKVIGYIEVLEQKAARLKTLTEDVVEASKVSSGNITLEMININLVEMLNQVEGEYLEKFESRDLTIVMNKPAEPVIIRADGQRLSRILENIYGNAYKYAMESTRIYADLQFGNGKAVFSLKNISEQALNITASELTERFIRGDVSRTTEGSGLGLSIAKSLTELQGGTFNLYLDGDLFKVTITFPLAD